VTQAQQAFELFYGVDGESPTGRSWTDVGDEMGLTRIQAKNAGAYWRKRDRVSRESRARYASDPDYRAKKLKESKDYRDRDPEAYRAQVKARRDANPERILEQSRASYHRHAERTNGERRERYANDPEYAEDKRAKALAYREANPEKCRARSRQYHREHRAEISAYQREWYANGGADWQRRYRAERTEHTARVFKLWRSKNAAHLKKYAQRYSFNNRPKLLLARSVWQFGPVWGPVHRAINDLKARIREADNE